MPRVESSSFFISSAPHAESSSGNTGNHLELWLVRWPTFRTERAEVLNARYLIARRAVVFGELRFDDDLWIELVRDHEIGCLVEAGQTLCPPGLAKADAPAGQNVLNGVLDDITDELADGIPMAGKRTAQEALVKQNRCREHPIPLMIER